MYADLLMGLMTAFASGESRVTASDSAAKHEEHGVQSGQGVPPKTGASLKPAGSS